MPEAWSMSRRLYGVTVGWLGISMVADAVPAVLLPHQLLSSGGDQATRLGIVTLLAITVGAAVQPLVGRISDARGRWPVIHVGVAMAAAGLLLLVSPGGTLAGAMLAVVGVSVTQAGYQPLLPDLVPRRQRGKGSGLKSALDVGGATAGFLVLALLLGDGGSLVSAVVLAAVLAASLGIAGLLLPKRAGPVRTERLPAGRQPGLLAELPPGLVGLTIGRFFFLLGIYAVGRFLLLFISDRFELGADAAAGQAGVVLGVLALATVAASIASGWLADRVGRRTLMLAGGGVAAVGIGLLPAAGSLPLLLAFGLLMSIGSAAFSTASWAALADVTATRDPGRLLGVANIGTAGAAAGAGAFGVLIDAGNAAEPGVGYVIAFSLAAAAALVGGLVTWRTAEATRTSIYSPLAEVSH